MSGFLRSVIDLIFPPPRDVVQARRVAEETVLQKLRLTLHTNSSTYTSLSYRDADVRALLRANKFHHDLHAAEVLGSVLFEMLAQFKEAHALRSEWKKPLIVPIPSSPRTLRVRGASQVEWIINTLPKNSLEHYLPNLLRRKNRTSQTHVARGKRAENIRGAFFVPRNKGRAAPLIAGASIILIDDVSESGETMKDAMRALKAAGARRTIGLALAK